MATGPAAFEYHLKAIRHTFQEMVKPYTGSILARGTQLGFVTFELCIRYNDRKVLREVGPFDMAEDFDYIKTRDKVGKALGEAARDACHEMMDPAGEMKTKSAREVYEEIGA